MGYIRGWMGILAGAVAEKEEVRPIVTHSKNTKMGQSIHAVAFRTSEYFDFISWRQAA